MNLRYKGIIDIFTKFSKKGFTIWFSGKEKEGEYKRWWANGQLWEHSFYKNGKLNGEHKVWHYEGKLVAHAFYKNGEEIRDIK